MHEVSIYEVSIHADSTYVLCEVFTCLFSLDTNFYIEHTRRSF